MPVNNKSRPSSYRRAFGSKTNYSTAGAARMAPLSKDRTSQSLQDLAQTGSNTGSNKKDDNNLNTKLSIDDIQAMYAAGRATHGPSEQLSSLNNRFASYIEKVRYLEEQNKILELKIKQAQKRKSEMEQNRDKDDEIKDLRHSSNSCRSWHND